jgi:colicin import membrane protein
MEEIMKKYLLIFSLVALVFILSGCLVDEELKKAVNEKTKLAQNELTTAQEVSTSKHAPKLYQAASEKLEEAKTDFQANQFQLANESLDEYFTIIEKANKKAKAIKQKIEAEKKKAEEAALKKAAEKTAKEAALKKAAIDAKIQAELAAKAQSEKQIKYTVQSGDSLWKIAKKLNIKRSAIAKVLDKNEQEIKNPNKLYVGQQIIVQKK